MIYHNSHFYYIGQPSGRPCAKCGEEMLKKAIPCPDGNLGCAVAHYQFYCMACERAKEEAFHHPQFFIPENP